ncbi:MAG: polysaccharide deacetylase family protein, partial [Candidatus Omnitrophica bacterium]|nr:polysaccharide deacetylase family protein [Candidatus Omnitrophota bacterium]
ETGNREYFEQMKNLFRYLVFGFLLVLIISGIFISVVERFYPYIPVLMYHSVSYSHDKENRLTVNIDTFRRQMDFLRKNNYKIVRLEEIPFLIKEKNKTSKTIAVSFDDGYKDNYLLAYPVLEKYKIPATIFLVVNDIATQDRLDWSQIKEMQSCGLISFGSHTLTHRDLTKLDYLDLKKEVFDSKRILEENLNSPIEILAYPAGFFNEKVKNTVKEAGYKLAVVASKGRGARSDDLFAYKRIRISNRDKNLLIFWFKTTKLYSFIKKKR